MSARLAPLLEQLLEKSPLRHAQFRRFYAGSIGTAVGYTMQATVAAWLMATLTPSALMVALVQTASTAPSLLFGLVAGALADLVDRRHIILTTQAMLLIATVALGVAEIFGVIGPWSLLVCTFLIGTGFTFYLPSQQVTVNDLVSRSEVSHAVALGAVAYNVARALGPALAGALAALLGTGSAFLAAAIFFTVMVFAIRGWKSPPRSHTSVPETLLSGIQSGLRYTRHSPHMRALLIHTLTFTICASALWALLPVIARDQLGLGAGGYGTLSASFGMGAIAGALLMPRLLHRVSLHALVLWSVGLWVVAALIISITGYTFVALLGACCAGAGWVGVLSSLAAGTQTAAPGWVRARSVAMNLIVSQASMAIGSALWGALASLYGSRIALATSAGVMALAYIVNRRIRVQLGDEADVTPGLPLPDMTIVTEPRPDDGPVLIQLEYRIDPEHRDAFLRTINGIEPVRRRNGAIDWRLFRDLGEEGRFVERFVIQSWAEYVRLRTRMTVADRQIMDQVGTLQRSGVPVRVSRLIGIDLMALEP